MKPSHREEIEEAKRSELGTLKFKVNVGIDELRSMSERCRIKSNETSDLEWEILADAYSDAVTIMETAIGPEDSKVKDNTLISILGEEE